MKAPPQGDRLRLYKVTPVPSAQMCFLTGSLETVLLNCFPGFGQQPNTSRGEEKADGLKGGLCSQRRCGRWPQPRLPGSTRMRDSLQRESYFLTRRGSLEQTLSTWGQRRPASFRTCLFLSNRVADDNQFLSSEANGFEL